MKTYVCNSVSGTEPLCNICHGIPTSRGPTYNIAIVLVKNCITDGLLIGPQSSCRKNFPTVIEKYITYKVLAEQRDFSSL